LVPTPTAAPTQALGSEVAPRTTAAAAPAELLADLRAVGATVGDLPLGPSEAFRLGLRNRLVTEAQQRAERMAERAPADRVPSDSATLGQRVCTALPDPAPATPQPPSGAPRPCRRRPRLGP
jgi:hypothetical protein